MRQIITFITLSLLSLSISYADSCIRLMRDQDKVNCYEEMLIDSDQKLNEQYKIKMEKLDAENKQELRAIQRDWMKLRDKDCAFKEKQASEASKELAKSACIANHTRERADALELLP